MHKARSEPSQSGDGERLCDCTGSVADDVAGSNPVIPTKKVVSFWYDFFYPLRSNGISSRFSVYLISPLGCISSLVRVYFPAVWWDTRPKARYTRFRTDDIQPLRVWWYTLSAKVIKMQAFLFLSVKYKSFTLCPFRSICRVSFNYCFHKIKALI